jgi:hypothetical protein
MDFVEEKTQSKTLTTPEFKKKMGSLFAYLTTHLQLRERPLVKLVNSKKNSDNDFGLTGHYDHEKKLITIYITDRHDTDILRTFAHEVIHHWQNERGTLHPKDSTSDNSTKAHYAQENPWLRRREMEAFLLGNLLFRDWQDEQRNGPPTTPPQMPQPLDENTVKCCGCAKPFDYSTAPEIAMGAVKCPNCLAHVNQEGLVLEVQKTPISQDTITYTSIGHDPRNKKNKIWFWRNDGEEFKVLPAKEGHLNHVGFGADFEGRFDADKNMVSIVDMSTFYKGGNTDLSRVPSNLLRRLKFEFGDNVSLKTFYEEGKI